MMTSTKKKKWIIPISENLSHRINSIEKKIIYIKCNAAFLREQIGRKQHKYASICQSQI